MRKTINRQAKRCEDCKYYPKHCGYWDESERAKHPNASYVNKHTEHNCPDFVPRIIEG